MELAGRHFNIPLVLEPEALASPHLDELSGMTYLSYFMKVRSTPLSLILYQFYTNLIFYQYYLSLK